MSAIDRMRERLDGLRFELSLAEVALEEIRREYDPVASRYYAAKGNRATIAEVVTAVENGIRSMEIAEDLDRHRERIEAHLTATGEK